MATTVTATVDAIAVVSALPLTPQKVQILKAPMIVTVTIATVIVTKAIKTVQSLSTMQTVIKPTKLTLQQ
jgi:hypothetical protein